MFIKISFQKKVGKSNFLSRLPVYENNQMLSRVDVFTEAFHAQLYLSKTNPKFFQIIISSNVSKQGLSTQVHCQKNGNVQQIFGCNRQQLLRYFPRLIEVLIFVFVSNCILKYLQLTTFKFPLNLTAHFVSSFICSKSGFTTAQIFCFFSVNYDTYL